VGLPKWWGQKFEVSSASELEAKYHPERELPSVNLSGEKSHPKHDLAVESLELVSHLEQELASVTLLEEKLHLEQTLA
jgi:hypothetical protein